MSPPLQPTEEQVAAAQLRMELDKKLGRETPEIVREIAAYRPTTRPTQHLRSLAEVYQGDATQASLALDRVARALEHRGELREQRSHAIAAWLAATQTPEPEVLNNLGNTLRELGRHDEAVNAYEQALSIYRRQHAEDPLEHSRADEPSTSE